MMKVKYSGSTGVLPKSATAIVWVVPMTSDQSNSVSQKGLLSVILDTGPTRDLASSR